MSLAINHRPGRYDSAKNLSDPAGVPPTTWSMSSPFGGASVIIPVLHFPFRDSPASTVRDAIASFVSPNSFVRSHRPVHS